MGAPAAVVVIGGVVISAFIAQYSAWACTSGEEAFRSLESDLCDGYAGTFGGLGWWLAVLWPAVVFGLSQLVPALRLGIRPFLVAVPVAVLGVAFWIATAAVVLDVG
jgi:hypothetical protein